MMIMGSRLIEIFEDRSLREKIAKKLPYLFSIAEIESSRAGKTGMEVGSFRERILAALLIYKFEEKNVETDIPITAPELDARLFGYPISIRTITGFGGVKFSWTVDAQKSREFVEKYSPKGDLLLTQIVWDGEGGLFYIPLEAQQRVFKTSGREKYFKLPKPETNPRGVEISKEALSRLIDDKESKSIKILWKRSKVDYAPYQRWIDYWKG